MNKRVRCIDCRYYPDDCGYWKPHRNANPVKPESWHGCPDFEPPAEPAPATPTPFTLDWDGNGCAALRRRDGYTVVAFMGERTYKRIKQAQDDGADFYALKALFPQKHSVYNA